MLVGLSPLRAIAQNNWLAALFLFQALSRLFQPVLHRTIGVILGEAFHLGLDKIEEGGGNYETRESRESPEKEENANYTTRSRFKSDGALRAPSLPSLIRAIGVIRGDSSLFASSACFVVK
jgi:hypothetical protein